MPAQHFVPTFASAMHASSKTQAQALRVIALSGDEPAEKDWQTRAAAALLIGAEWAGEPCTPAEVAQATGVPEKKVAEHYAALANRMRRWAP